MKKISLLLFLVIGVVLCGCTQPQNTTSYSVTFDSQGGSLVESQKVSVNGLAVRPVDPIKENMVFDGWYLNGQLYDFSTPVTQNLILVAMWRDSSAIKITLDTQGGNELAPITDAEQGEKILLPTPERLGYTFKGWYLSSDTKPNDKVTTMYTVNESVTLYAGWQAVNYKITFDTKSEVVVEAMTAAYQSKVELPNPTRMDYNFEGWYLNGELFTGESMPAEEITLEAKWSIKLYTITFNTDGGECEVEMLENVEAGSTVTMPVPTKTNCFFLGWFTADGVQVISETEIKSDLELTAKWDDLGNYQETYEITYNLDGGDFYLFDSREAMVNELLSEVSTFLNQSIIRSEFAAKAANGLSGANGFFAAGNNYNKWSFLLNYLQTLVKDEYKELFSNKITNTKFTNESIIANELAAFMMQTKLTQATAPYATSADYSSESVADGYLSSIKINVPTSYDTGVGLELPVPYKTGFIFKGWYEDELFFGPNVKEITITEHEDKNYYAKWEVMKEQYVVTFLDQNGNVYAEQNVRYGGVVENISTPATTGYELIWYLGRNAFDVKTPIYQDTTVFAAWKILEDVLPNLLPEETFDNIGLLKSYETTAGKATISYSSSAPNTLSNTGITNPARVDELVRYTTTFTLNSQRIKVPLDVLVTAITFEELPKPAVFGYFYSKMNNYTGLDEVSASALDVINYSFARCTEDGDVSISGLNRLTEVLQARKQGVRVVLCIGGYGAANYTFSDAAFTQEGRNKFAQSILDLVNEYHFDGVDIDWEYPGYETGRDTEVDRPNYTSLMATVKKYLKDANPDYLVTAALPGGPWGIDRFDVASLNNILDYIHLMTYDFHSSTKVVHHTALYPSSKGTTTGCSVTQTVSLFNSRGVDLDKLVVGAAFYGRKYVLTEAVANASVLGSTKVASSGGNVNYTEIYNNYLMNVDNKNIFNIWDNEACAPYIYDKANKVVISYDSMTSIRYKCEYVINHDLGGIMFWDYGEDLTRKLITQINTSMKSDK